MKANFMKKVLYILAAVIVGCSSNNDKPATENSTPAAEAVASSNPKGYGRISEVKLGAIDQALVAKGKGIFDTKCVACHRLDSRLAAPPLRKITEQRTPEWIMNMMLDTEIMLEKDANVKALVQEYLVQMPNQHIDEQEARSILEFFRDADTKPASNE